VSQSLAVQQAWLITLPQGYVSLFHFRSLRNDRWALLLGLRPSTMSVASVLLHHATGPGDNALIKQSSWRNVLTCCQIPMSKSLMTTHMSVNFCCDYMLPCLLYPYICFPCKTIISGINYHKIEIKLTPWIWLLWKIWICAGLQSQRIDSVLKFTLSGLNRCRKFRGTLGFGGVLGTIIVKV
jgi:hypothetical protein